jgi:hypothetical protein
MSLFQAAEKFVENIESNPDGCLQPAWFVTANNSAIVHAWSVTPRRLRWCLAVRWMDTAEVEKANQQRGWMLQVFQHLCGNAG